MTAPESIPARFWPRYVAWSLDAACLLPVIALLGLPIMRAALARAEQALHALSAGMARMLDASLAQTPIQLATALLADTGLAANVHALSGAITTLLLAPPLLYALAACVWSLGFECSSWQATPGKRALGLRVTNAGGGRLTPRNALLRFLAAGLSWLTLNLGHAMVTLPPHLALHDRLSHTRVIATAPTTALPRWARAWLWLQVLAMLVACVWLFHALQAWSQSVMQQALGGL